MKRRDFLKNVAALMAAPAVVSAGNIMRIEPLVIPDQELRVFSGSIKLSHDGHAGDIYVTQTNDETTLYVFDGMAWVTTDECRIVHGNRVIFKGD